MGRQLIDPDTADRFLSGMPAPEAAPAGFSDVAELLRAARTPPTPQELAWCADTVVAMEEAIAAGASGPSRQTRRRVGH
jgi:hypothetical protein